MLPVCLLGTVEARAILKNHTRLMAKDEFEKLDAKDKAEKPVTARKFRRSRGFEPLSDRLPGLTDEILRKRGFVKTELVRRWADIVGPDLAPLCQPLEIRYPGMAARDGVLTLKASGAAAPLIDMETPRLIDRINSFYGYAAIGRIKIQQVSGRTTPKSAHSAPEKSGLAALFDGESAAENRPTKAAVDKIGNRVKGVEDPALQQALKSLGEKILVDKS